MQRRFSLSMGIGARALAAGVALSIAPIPGISASDFPTQPVEITVLFGGPVATIAQMLAEGMSKQLNGPVVAVLELMAGEAKRLGIEPGDRVVHPHFTPKR